MEKLNNKSILNKKSIIVCSGIFKNIYFLYIFIFVGLIILFIVFSKNEIINSNRIIGIIIGTFMCLFPIIYLLKVLKKVYRIVKGQYVIVLDELADKYYNEHHDGTDSIRTSRWQLYFKYYYQKYNVYIMIDSLKKGDNYNIGDKFYLVFVKGNKSPYIFPLKEYTLDGNEDDKLKTLELAEEYIKQKEFKLKYDDMNNVLINKERIKNDFYDKKDKVTIATYIMIIIFILFFMFCIYSFDFEFKIFSLILLLIVFIFFCFITILKIKFITTILRNIKSNEFNIKIDMVKSLNNNLDFINSNEMISFKFQDYKEIVFDYKRKYKEILIGDEFYLIFVKENKEPIAVYRKKDSTINEDIISQLIL